MVNSRDDNRQPCSSMTDQRQDRTNDLKTLHHITSHHIAPHRTASHRMAWHRIQYPTNQASHRTAAMDRVVNFRLAGDEAIDNSHPNSI